MSGLLLVILGYSTASYIGSGSICYLLSKALLSSNNLQKLVKLWVLFLWPLWIMKEINQDVKTSS
jgi:hypothetical protein